MFEVGSFSKSKRFPQEERLELVEKLFQLTEADVPESLRQGMGEAARGQLLDLDDALSELDRP